MNLPGPEIRHPRVLIFDLETSPNIAYTWGKYDQDVIEFIQERMIISMAWKFLGEKKVQSISIPDFYGYKKQVVLKNRKLIQKIHKLFMMADVLVAQNGDNFDVKMANSEFVQYGLKPPPNHKTVDTLKIAKKKFRFNSNKLDHMAKRLGIGGKVETGGFKLWEGCLAGNKSAWAKMIRYNKRDVAILEKLYIKFAPWAGQHPNMNAFDFKRGCVVCKSTSVRKNGFTITVNGKRQRYQCRDCGKWMCGELKNGGFEYK
jgi:hypothetical protein